MELREEELDMMLDTEDVLRLLRGCDSKWRTVRGGAVRFCAALLGKVRIDS